MTFDSVLRMYNGSANVHITRAVMTLVRFTAIHVGYELDRSDITLQAMRLLFVAKQTLRHA